MKSIRICPACGEEFESREWAVCPSCLAHLPRTYLCEQQQNALLWSSPDFPHLDRVVPFCFYDHSHIRELVHAFKYYDRQDVAFDLACVFAREWKAAGQCPSFDAIVPVPLHWYKYMRRGYNQAECIAQGLSAVLGVPVVKALRRRRYAKSQTRNATHASRWSNVQGAFTLRRGVETELRGMRVLLVDDVITTGATVSSCIAELLKVEGLRLSLASLAAPYKLCTRHITEEDLVRVWESGFGTLR